MKLNLALVHQTSAEHARSIADVIPDYHSIRNQWTGDQSMPLGWHVSVYRQTANRSVPATADAKAGLRIAVWQTGLWGLQWIEDLVQSGRGHSVVCVMFSKSSDA